MCGEASGAGVGEQWNSGEPNFEIIVICKAPRVKFLSNFLFSNCEFFKLTKVPIKR